MAAQWLTSFSFFLMFGAVALVLSNEDCLDCWNRLCDSSGDFPADCAQSTNDTCIDYGAVDRNESELHSNEDQCCAAAEGYVDRLVEHIPQQSHGDQFSCSTAYNEPRVDTDTSNFDTLSSSAQYVFSSIQFGCHGCITNITFYTNSSQQQQASFNIQFWRHYSDSSTVLMLVSNHSVNVLEPLVYIPRSGSSHSTTISLDNKKICFDPGEVFGLSIPSLEAFNLDLLREKPGFTNTTVYRRERQSCESLERIFFLQSAESDGNILIALRVSTVTASTVTSTEPTVQPTPFAAPLTIIITTVVILIFLAAFAIIVILTIAYIIIKAKARTKRAKRNRNPQVDLRMYNQKNPSDSMQPLYQNLQQPTVSHIETALGTDNPLYKSAKWTCESSNDSLDVDNLAASENPLYKTIHQTTGSPAGDIIYWEPSQDASKLFLQISSNNFARISRSEIDIQNELGSGHFGTVFSGVWETENGERHHIAIKSLKKETQLEKVKFLQEAAIMGQFTHPSIVKLHGVVTVGNPVMIITDLMTNGDLKNVLPTLSLDQPNRLSHQLLGFCRQIASGMEYLSKKCFVHRDLAARNILVDDTMRCVIGDFGMARDLMDDTYYISRGGKIPVRWTAPEALHYKKYSTASDVWSYGVVLFEIWGLGKQPYRAHKPTEVIDFLDAGNRQYPPPGCSYPIYELMIQCWHPTTSKRPKFESIVDLLAASDMEVLDRDRDNKEQQLGAALEHGRLLYPKLQETYMHLKHS